MKEDVAVQKFKFELVIAVLRVTRARVLIPIYYHPCSMNLVCSL